MLSVRFKASSSFMRATTCSELLIMKQSTETGGPRRSVINLFIRSPKCDGPMELVKYIDRSPLDRCKLTDSVQASYFVLAMTTRQAHRPDPLDLSLFGNFIFSHCERARYNRAFAFFTNVSREVEILFFHAGVESNCCISRVASNYRKSTVKIDQSISQG